ncbi:hypothetical protein [Microbacterium sp. JZ31]|uniref:hypothetical protein n=1 Tax=Microbacterium sp. JZ31 TaxID=1906274 RepID=UPI0019337B12|nr:hypothetical protein [Microbacterium sp. JZ31]
MLALSSVDPEDIIGPLAGFSVLAVLVGIVMYLGMLALMLWLFYLVIRTAVKNGILKADEERAARGFAAGPLASHIPPDGRAGYGPPVP